MRALIKLTMIMLSFSMISISSFAECETELKIAQELLVNCAKVAQDQGKIIKEAQIQIEDQKKLIVLKEEQTDLAKEETKQYKTMGIVSLIGFILVLL